LGGRKREDGFGPHQEAFWWEDAYADVSIAQILIGTMFELHSYLRHSFSLSRPGCDCGYCLVVEKLVECEDLVPASTDMTCSPPVLPSILRVHCQVETFTLLE
jgi:hypothetical protein